MGYDSVAVQQDIKKLSTVLTKNSVDGTQKLRDVSDKFKEGAKRTEKIQDTEEVLQEKKKAHAEKQSDFLFGSVRAWKKSKDEQWKLIKENHKVFKIARAFWQSEAGQ